jgi:hypothetical protein
MQPWLGLRQEQRRGARNSRDASWRSVPRPVPGRIGLGDPLVRTQDACEVVNSEDSGNRSNGAGRRASPEWIADGATSES